MNGTEIIQRAVERCHNLDGNEICIDPDRADVCPTCLAKEIDAALGGLKSDIVKLLNLLAAPTNCRGCGRKVWFVVNKGGRSMPITDEGKSHHIDCPKADDFRKRGAK